MASSGVLIICFLLGSSLSAGAQSAAPPIEQGSSCVVSCIVSSGLCHHQRALYFLRGYEYSLPKCLLSDLHSLPHAEDVSRIKLGLHELEVAIANPSGLAETNMQLRIEKAEALTALAYAQISSGEPGPAGQSMDQAAAAYHVLVREEGESREFEALIPRIAVGFIRCGRAADALSLLIRRRPNDPDRLYLWAEASFSIGARKDAARTYEDWIAGGCQSEVTMLTNDEFGVRWTLLFSKKPEHLSRCEQLPSELRTRLETLRQQFHHPDNLPPHNYDAMLFPASADY
jgi:hypothetical protein